MLKNVVLVAALLMAVGCGKTATTADADVGTDDAVDTADVDAVEVSTDATAVDAPVDVSVVDVPASVTADVSK